MYVQPVVFWQIYSKTESEQGCDLRCGVEFCSSLATFENMGNGEWLTNKLTKMVSHKKNVKN